MNKVEEIEEFHQLTDEEIEQYELRSGNVVIRVESVINLSDRRNGIGKYLNSITGTYTVIDCDVDTFRVQDYKGRIFDVLWWDVSGYNPNILLEKIKY